MKYTLLIGLLALLLPSCSDDEYCHLRVIGKNNTTNQVVDIVEIVPDQQEGDRMCDEYRNSAVITVSSCTITCK
ncbi:MAG: hypothetical protein IPH94_00175 [Saprospiraceae bacterium]|nr:hypothetical protein [Saprospiraceae bacterium]